MDEAKNGVAGSSSKPEPSIPKEISSPLDEKKVSTKSNRAPLRKKRFLMECDERPDGSLSKCFLVPINEVKESLPHQDVSTEKVLPINDRVDGSINRYTEQKCPICFSIRRKAIEKKLKVEDKSQKHS